MSYLTKSNKKTGADKSIAKFTMATWTGPDCDRKFTLMFYNHEEKRSYLADFSKREFEYIKNEFHREEV